MIKINEIFYSIQGESTFAGLPTTFVRTTGCNLRCEYCDTKYSYYEGQFISASELIQKIKSFPTKLVCITGGEPLLQKEILSVMKTLADDGFKISLETSGSKSIEHVDARVKSILDVKTPGSGEVESFLNENLKFANRLTEFKFVICDENDFNWSDQFCRQHDLYGKFEILFSPSYKKVSEQWLAEQILKKNLNVRLQLQLHKYIWLPETRGV